jgi:hypothetical protein
VPNRKSFLVLIILVATDVSKTTRFFEIAEATYQSTQRNIPKILQPNRCENLGISTSCIFTPLRHVRSSQCTQKCHLCRVILCQALDLKAQHPSPCKRFVYDTLRRKFILLTAANIYLMNNTCISAHT